jgi:hypothetical protein
VFTIWTGILLVEIENPPSGRKKKTLGEMVDQVKSESIIDLLVFVMEYFNMPRPDEGGLIYKLRALGLELGK